MDKPTEKVIVSPAQKNMPQIQTSGRKVIVELQDSLIPNTTYTIDFSDAISDNNERNPLYNFSFSFATGNSIDTLQIGGILLNAENLEPVTGMLVGLHSNLNDSDAKDCQIRCIRTILHKKHRSGDISHIRTERRKPGLQIR